MTIIKYHQIDDDDDLLNVSIDSIYIRVYSDPYNHGYCLLYHDLTVSRISYYASMYSDDLEYLIKRAQRLITNLQDEVE